MTGGAEIFRKVQKLDEKKGLWSLLFHDGVLLLSVMALCVLSQRVNIWTGLEADLAGHGNVAHVLRLYVLPVRDAAG